MERGLVWSGSGAPRVRSCARCQPMHACRMHVRACACVFVCVATACLHIIAS